MRDGSAVTFQRVEFFREVLGLASASDALYVVFPSCPGWLQDLPELAPSFAGSGLSHQSFDLALGSVAVNAIAEDAFQRHLDSKTRQGELERQRLQREIRKTECEIANRRNGDDKLWKILQTDPDNSEKRMPGASLTTRPRTDERTRRARSNSGTISHWARYFFDGLPAVIATTKTDTDGKFTLGIPRQGRFGVAVCASHETLADKRKDTYFWFVWVSLDRQLSHHLVLTNDNVLGAGSADSALR